jgi:PleD family two-component response regulator
LQYEAHFDRAPMVLLAVSPETEMQLRPLLAQCGARIHAVSSCQQAKAALALNPEIDAVFTSLCFSDGCFADLARQAGGEEQKTVPAIACVETLDAGCTDVLELGAFTVLAPPYTLEQMRWVLGECMKQQAGAEAR